MKPTQYFALIIGILFTLIGIAGFIPGLVQPPAADPHEVGLGLTTGYGYLMGLFPINLLHNIIHLTVGLLGILASIALDSARLYSGVLGLFYAVLVVFGLFPPTQSTLGLVPIFGNDVWLHALTSAIAIYFGFFATPDLAQIGEQGGQEQMNQERAGSIR